MKNNSGSLPRKIPVKNRRTRKNVPKGFDSWLEYDLYQVLKGCKYHSETVKYIQEKQYHPDFIFHNGRYKVYIEAKGRFRDKAEARKYVDVKAGLNKWETLVFIFQNPMTPMPGARKRQDGTKFTMADWANKHGFNWYSREDLPPQWRGL